MTGPVGVPAWRVTLDGVDITAKMTGRLMRLRVSERRGDMADQLDIELDDSDGGLAIPKAGAEIALSLGWSSGDAVEAGLVDKGRFVVDEASHASPPATITLRARSADFTAQWRKLRDQSWAGKTLRTILTEIAARQSVTLKIAATLGTRTVELVSQSRESDAALVMRLGHEHDAVATVKNGCLIFVPMAGGKSAGGETLPPVTIRAGEGDGHDYRIEAQEDYTGVIAHWHDKSTGKQQEVRAGRRKKNAVPVVAKKDRTRPAATAGSTDNPKRLKKIFASKAAAEQAAQAEWSRIMRAPRKLSLSLAFGRPEIGAEQPAKVEGFHPEIDAQDWIVAEVTHTLDRRGLTSALSLEIPETPAEADDAADG